MRRLAQILFASQLSTTIILAAVLLQCDSPASGAVLPKTLQKTLNCQVTLVHARATASQSTRQMPGARDRCAPAPPALDHHARTKPTIRLRPHAPGNPS